MNGYEFHIGFYVPGRPAPQGSKRHVGRGIMVESSTEVGAWRERVALVAHNAIQHHPVFDGPVCIRLSFVVPRPKSTPKSYTPAASKRPDVDKLARACLDAVTGVVITDDARVIRLSACKRLAEVGETPGVDVEIYSAVQDGCA